MTAPAASWPLNQTGTITLNASGNGTVQLRPDGPREHWQPSLASFKTAQTIITKEAQCRVYIGPVATDQYFVDGSLSGSTGDSTGKVAGSDISRAGPLPSIWAVWTGGDPGAVATLSVSGSVSLGQGGGTPFSTGPGCSNPIIGGGGALVYPAIHSPNYVLNVSGWSINKDGTAQFTGIVLIGGTFTGTNFIINSSGSFFYSGAPALGNLIASITNAGGTDAKGNVYFGGVCSYDPSFTPKTVAQLFTGSLQLGTSTQIAGTGGATAGGLSIFNPSIGGAVDLSSGGINAADLVAQLIAYSSSQNPQGGTLPEFNFNAPLAILGTATPGFTNNPGIVQWADINGYLRYRSANSGETINYEGGHNTLRRSTDQLVNSLVYADICGGNWGVGAGGYRVHAELTVLQGPNAAANNFRLGFTGTITSVRTKLIEVQDGTNSFLATGAGNNTTLATHGFAAGSTYSATLHGTIVTSSSGILSWQAQMSAAADTFTVLALSDAHLEPI